MKRKVVSVAISALLCTSMVGAGFASWFITGNANDTASGSITVEQVVDERVRLSVGVESNSVIFGGSAEETDPCDWLECDSTENLTVTFTATVTMAEGSLPEGYEYSLTAGTVTATGGDGENTGYGAALADGYVGALPTPTVTKNEGTNGEFTVTVTFAWGSFFNYQNPEVFYGQSASETKEADAKTALNKLYSQLNGVGYTFTLTASLVKSTSSDS